MRCTVAMVTLRPVGIGNATTSFLEIQVRDI